MVLFFLPPHPFDKWSQPELFPDLCSYFISSYLPYGWMLSLLTLPPLGLQCVSKTRNMSASLSITDLSVFQGTAKKPGGYQWERFRMCAQHVRRLTKLSCSNKSGLPPIYVKRLYKPEVAPCVLLPEFGVEL